MQRIPNKASHYENMSMSSRRIEGVTLFSAGNERELILKGRNEMGQNWQSFNIDVDGDSGSHL